MKITADATMIERILVIPVAGLFQQSEVADNVPLRGAPSERPRNLSQNQKLV
jgi:hypothetical protein